MPSSLLIAVCLRDESTRRRMLPIVQELASRRDFVPTRQLVVQGVESFDDLESLGKRLERHYAEAPRPTAIILSDQLSDDSSKVGEEFDFHAKERVDPDHFPEAGTLAVTQTGEPISGIDRVVSHDANATDMMTALGRIVGRLEYLQRPEEQHFAHAAICGSPDQRRT